MHITYREAVPSDAAQLLAYLKIVGGESDNLTFGSDGIPVTVEQEEALLKRIGESDHSRFFLALDGDRIVGNACVDGNGNPRMRHRRNLAITVMRDYWGRHIGTGLMERMIAFTRETGAELLSLEVRSDNERAKALYRKFGFQSFGTFPDYFKINGAYFDVDCMTLDLRRSNPTQGTVQNH
ncbi:MAG: GNAT family N-acetyltransferase [Oscillospiraceae bacterium]|nr:GNAT family N-acetyltransferase [Oscillospiraceae bacterium]